jgi:NAD(P)-dependent dehydrogenase (short-subunit alcohol dehydrogenase family)
MIAPSSSRATSAHPSLQQSLAPANIRVNTVALAFVETPAYERFMTPEQARSVLESVHAFHPLGRHGYPTDVVEAILFLAGDRAGWITGTTLPIDGGVLAGRSAPPAPVRDHARA